MSLRIDSGGPVPADDVVQTQDVDLQPATAPAPAEPARHAAPPAPLPEPAPPVVAEPRRTEIDAFVADHHDAATRFLGVRTDTDAGEVIGDALIGDSELGPLSPDERRYMAERASAEWLRDGNEEAVREMADRVAGAPHAARDVALALALPAGDTARLHARGIATIDAPESAAFRGLMLEQAMGLDGAATIEAFAGAEAELGRRAAHVDDGERNGMFRAVAEGRVVPGAADAFVTAAFLHGDGDFVRDDRSRQALAGALAAVTNTDTSPYSATSQAMLEARLDGILAGDGGGALLLDPEIRPELRGWALGQIAADRDFTAETLAEGWDSDVVSEAFARTSLDAYRARGTEAVALGGEALRNTIGQSLGLAPDLLPPENESPAAAEARLAAGMDHRYYGDSPAIDAIADRIREVGGPGARISVVPVTVTSDAFGAASVPTFRVETAGGDVRVVDHEGLKYDSVAEWESENRLPPGTATYPAGLDLAADRVVTANTPEVNDTFWEGAREVGNYVAIGAGIVAGGIAIAATGGLATPGVVAAGTALGAGAASWGAVQSGSELAELHDRGVDITDLSDPEVRSHVINGAASVLSLGAMAGAARVASSGLQLGTHSARTVAGIQVAANVADTAAIGDQAVALARNWDDLDTGERAAGVLNMAFWAGLGAAQTTAGGGALRDAFDFRHLSNQLEFGAPYPVMRNDALAPGEMRVPYEVSGGTAGNIRIETGPGPVDRTLLDLHVATARHIEGAGTLRGRVDEMLGGRTPEIGSAAWEARLEIAKIETEAHGISAALSDPDLPRADRDALETRLRELDQAVTRQGERLATMDAGEGFVAAPRSLTAIIDEYAASGDIRVGLPNGQTSIDRPGADAAARIDYGEVNEAGQAQGISATLTKESVDAGTGTDARSSIRPPGFPEKGTTGHNFSRGHLLARRLGGSGDMEENLVTLYQLDTNSPVHSSFEDAIYDAVQAGEVVNYQVTPIYEGDGMPTSLAISARGSEGFELDITLINRDGSR